PVLVKTPAVEQPVSVNAETLMVPNVLGLPQVFVPFSSGMLPPLVPVLTKAAVPNDPPAAEVREELVTPAASADPVSVPAAAATVQVLASRQLVPLMTI